MSPRYPHTTEIPPVCCVSFRWSRFNIKLLQSSSIGRGGLSRKQSSWEVREEVPQLAKLLVALLMILLLQVLPPSGLCFLSLFLYREGMWGGGGVALIFLRQGWESWMKCSVWSLVLWEYDTEPGFQAGRSGRAEHLDAGKDWRQEEKGMTEDKMVGWHYQVDGHEFEQALGVSDGQGSLACCSPWGRRVRHDWATELKVIQVLDSQRVFVSGTGMQGMSLDRETGRLFRILEASNGGENSKDHRGWINVQLDLKDPCSARCRQSVLEGVCHWGTHIGGRDCSPAAACPWSLITPHHITAFSCDRFWEWGPKPEFSALWPLLAFYISCAPHPWWSHPVDSGVAAARLCYLFLPWWLRQ